jgi:high frequency lysogenization protein
MSIKNTTNQAISLAGIAQTCLLVEELANTGQTHQDALEANLASILKIDAESVIDIYGDLKNLRFGLQQLQKQLTGDRSFGNPDQARYAASLVFLERQLSNRPEMLKQIQTGIVKAQNQSEIFGLMHENVLANLGDLYHSTISTLQPRILVNGKEEYLRQTHIVNKIRALLLSGIRSAMLWRQCGGSRWKFLFFRKKLQDEIAFLLNEVNKN